jgi:hypothetical protein
LFIGPIGGWQTAPAGHNLRGRERRRVVVQDRPDVRGKARVDLFGDGQVGESRLTQPQLLMVPVAPGDIKSPRVAVETERLATLASRLARG